ncbi:hypothetical protein D9758_015629 [Tetrapyrgos nigripes]|uniref:SAP domain-containing protein n=1 Tax=Tetrapyrgos nigripes TaxID=182062 RepID=A0A8H5FNL3_9AGAR|nr:hypothetical protein D9758_015629 [Tetrapyrgos nigripes]
MPVRESRSPPILTLQLGPARMDTHTAIPIPIDPALLALSSPARSMRSDDSADHMLPQAEASSSDPASGPVHTAKSRKRLSPVSVKPPNYKKLKKSELQSLCREKGLPEDGRKETLIERLKGQNASITTLTIPMPAPRTSITHLSTTAAVVTPSGSDAEYAASINADQILDDVRILEGSFEEGYRGTSVGQTQEDEEGGTESDSDDENEVEGSSVNSSVPFSPEQVDAAIMNSRRKSGRRTEQSVLNQWKKWVVGAIEAGIIPDDIVDAHHTIQFMQYQSNRQLFTKRGIPKPGNSCLSSIVLAEEKHDHAGTSPRPTGC